MDEKEKLIKLAKGIKQILEAFREITGIFKDEQMRNFMEEATRNILKIENYIEELEEGGQPDQKERLYPGIDNNEEEK